MRAWGGCWHGWRKPASSTTRSWFSWATTGCLRGSTGWATNAPRTSPACACRCWCDNPVSRKPRSWSARRSPSMSPRACWSSAGPAPWKTSTANPGSTSTTTKRSSLAPPTSAPCGRRSAATSSKTPPARRKRSNSKRSSPPQCDPSDSRNKPIGCRWMPESKPSCRTKRSGNRIRSDQGAEGQAAVQDLATFRIRPSSSRWRALSSA